MNLHVSRPWHVQALVGTLLVAALSSIGAGLAPPAAESAKGQVAAAATPQLQPTRGTQEGPNVLFVLVDDMSLDQLQYLEQVNALIADRGVTFARAYSSYPLCCPARATILTGQYPHNHQVMSNAPPLGGVTAFRDEQTLPVWMERSGYSTVLIGKYLNQYRRMPTYIPPGWTDWRGLITELNYRTWKYNDNGRRVSVEDRYQTDVMARQAENAVIRYGKRDQPFFMYLSFIAPHTGLPREPDDFLGFPSPNVSGRYRDALADVVPPIPANLNEADLSDKPTYLRDRRKVPRERTLEFWQQRTEALLSVDDAVARLIGALRQIRELRNTIVVFASDNGFLLGEHRWTGKSVPYEEATHVPLLIRGPGFQPGTTASQLVSLIDLAPTFVRAAGGKPRRTIDGVDLRRVASDPSFAQDRSIVIEGGVASLVPPDSPTDGQHRYYWGVRTPEDEVLVRYATGEREYYDLATDPAQLENTVDRPGSQESVERLSQLLALLRNCVGRGCRATVPLE